MPALGTDAVTGRHVVFFSWRDTSNPEGGGAERYLEKMAHGLVERGVRVTIFCAGHPGAPADEVRDGIRFVRAGSKMGVYAQGLVALARRRFGAYDAIVDVQNGLPFFTRLASRRPVIVLVHHVHREQWPVVYPGPTGTVGWWIESRLAPRLYRTSQYIAVSQATRAELATLGVGPRAHLGRAQRHRPCSPAAGRQDGVPLGLRRRAGWCRTSRSSTRSTPSQPCGRCTPICGSPSSGLVGGSRSCTTTPRRPARATRSCSRATWTRSASSGSTPSRG